MGEELAENTSIEDPQTGIGDGSQGKKRTLELWSGRDLISNGWHLLIRIPKSGNAPSQAAY